MDIAGLTKNSFVDFPGEIAAVIFTRGCNYDCFFCHNRLLIGHDSSLIDNDEVFAFLKKRVNLLDGVVITGGEPTLQRELKDFIIKVKDLGYKIKLDTNGSCPNVILDLIKNDLDLIDYIAMDYKAPFDRYMDICGVDIDVKKVKESLEIIKQSSVNYELRTTFIPQLDLDDIEVMLSEVNPIDCFAIQQYRMPDVYKECDLFKLKKEVHSSEDIKKAEEIAKKYAKKVIIR